MIIRYLALAFLFMEFSISSAHAIFAQSADNALSYNNVYAPAYAPENNKTAAEDKAEYGTKTVDLTSSDTGSTGSIQLGYVLEVKINNGCSCSVRFSPSSSWRESSHVQNSGCTYTYTFVPLRRTSGTIYFDGKDSAGEQKMKELEFKILE
jgi:hypothetical protein